MNRTDLPDDKLREIVEGFPKELLGEDDTSSSAATAPATASKAEPTSAEKKLKNLKKKMTEIQKLKEKKAKGEKIEKNQVIL